MIVNKYNIYCVTDARWETRWDVSEPTTCPTNASHTINSALTTILQTVNDASTSVITNSTIDTFGRLRTSNPFTILDWTHVAPTGTQEETFVVTGTGTYAEDATLPCAIGTVTNLGTIKVQSRRRGIYQPGKSLLVYITGILNYNSNAVGCTSRLGYYDDNNGYFFEYSNPTVYLVERSYGVDTKIAQSNWNVNSYNPLDITKAQIFMFDFEWLGVGRVRAGLVVDGAFVYLHNFNHSNLLPKPYIGTASLYLRCELFNTGASQNGKFMHICGSVISEGGFNAFGRCFVADTGIATPAVTTTIRPIISLRFKSASVARNVFLQNMSMQSISASRLRVILYLFRDRTDATFLTGPSWVSADATSACEYDISATAITVTNPYILFTGYMADINSNFNFQTGENDNAILTKNVSGNTDYLVLAAQTLTANENVVASIKWKEVI